MKCKQSNIIWCESGPLPFYFGFCPGENAWKKHVKRLGFATPYPDNDMLHSSWTNQQGDLECVITVGEHMDNSTSMLSLSALMVHEAVHVWERVCKHMGETNPHGSVELQAYYVQHIYKELMMAYTNSRKPRGLPGH